ncbi:Clp protease N-terminal domain-containing protein [Catellatospora paridis]|uniref:Clp protease N-terminal domain-containing protein n=1 Tax=Catellatospora paridis TaxID=1617086 RepID=UPI0012D3CB12
MFERFTTAAREVVRGAQDEARHCGQQHYLGTEHLLLGLLRPTSGIPYDLLTTDGLDHDQVTAAISRHLGTAEPFGAADAAALQAIGIDLDAVRAKLEETFGPGALNQVTPPPRRGLFRRRPHVAVSEGRHIPFTPRSKVVLELSLREALRLKHKYIGTEHILLGMIREGKGLAALIMTEAGIDLDDLRRRTEQAIAARD